MTDDVKLPPLRALDITQTQGPDGQWYLVLHDMQGLAPRSLAVSALGLHVLTHLDGEHTVADVQAVYTRELGAPLPDEQITELVRVLDEGLMLANDRYAAAVAVRTAAYQAAPTRDNRARYPDGVTLRAELRDIVARGTVTPLGEVRGLIAPHLDYERGGPCYAPAYATLAQATPADRYIILGTNHAGRSHAAVATTKPFETPLGIAPTDTDFIRRLESRVGAALTRCEDDHLMEHSIELQVHFLQALIDQPFTIVPILCPSPCGPTGTRPYDGQGPDLGGVADALRDLLAADAQRTVIIAGADLSHVGQRFGDADPTTDEFLAAVRARDQKLLTRIAAREDAELVADLTQNENPTRVCSVGCLYTLLRALPGRPCTILGYHLAEDREQETHVSCMAAVVT